VPRHADEERAVVAAVHVVGHILQQNKVLVMMVMVMAMVVVVVMVSPLYML
jgi:Zn-dependent membrane protease YugP